MAVAVVVSTMGGVPPFETLDELSAIRDSYPVIEDWRGWWQNVHTGTLILVTHKNDLGRIGFFYHSRSKWVIEHWRKLDGEPPNPPDHQLRQLSLFTQP